MEENKNEVEETIKNTEEIADEIKDEFHEQEDIVLEKELGITKTTYNEFYKITGGIASQIKSTAFLCIGMLLILYLIEKKNEEFNWGHFGIQAAIYCGIIIGVTVIFTLITRFVLQPKQYEKNHFEQLRIKYQFSNIGIRQTVQEQSVLAHWTSFVKGTETDNSFFFIGMNRRGLLFSKEELSNDEILIVRGLAETHLQGNFQTKIKEK